jgi:hypothetical protein
MVPRKNIKNLQNFRGGNSIFTSGAGGKPQGVSGADSKAGGIKVRATGTYQDPLRLLFYFLPWNNFFVTILFIFSYIVEK